MKSDGVASRMRRIEQATDLQALPGTFLVARIDGRNFTRLTKSESRFEAPFDWRFAELMLVTARHLMNCGFRARLAYLQSDEISLIIDPDDDTFARRISKLLSVLAGEASAAFSAALGEPAAFDCRILQLQSVEQVCEYCLWRQDDAARNALSAHCYWLLRRRGKDASDATAALRGLLFAAKHDLLHSDGINYNDLPAWQRRGMALAWQRIPGKAINPVDGIEQSFQRSKLTDYLELPIKAEFAAWVSSIVASAEA